MRPRNKYGNKKCEADGYTFSSQLERSVYYCLRLRERAGLIRLDMLQDSVKMTDAKILYRPDFRIIVLKTNETRWVEAKGKSTATWSIKLRLWKCYGPGPLEIWTGTADRPNFKELIIPRKPK